MATDPLTYGQSRAHDGCFKRLIHKIAKNKNLALIMFMRNMGAEMEVTKEKKDRPLVDWSDFRSYQAYHQKIVDAKAKAAVAKAALETIERKSVKLPPNTLEVKKDKSGFTPSDDGLTDQQAQLICAIFVSTGSYEKIHAICQTDLNWNFTAYVPGRTDAVTPLSLLCRPELCNALPEIRAHPKEIADGLQLNLIEYAISNGTKDKDIWKDKEPSVDPLFANRRAISDTVYQGRVDILRLLIEYFPEIANVLKTKLDFGSSYLHMAAHDGRTEMAIFLIDEMGIEVEIESTKDAPKSCRGQTPLFWCFARGVVNAKCAFALVDRGADPNRLWHATRDGQRIATLSPLSMALVTCPEFAHKVLANQRPRVGNRGLKQVFRPTFINSLVSEDGKELLFAPQIDVTPGTVWETFNYDRRPHTFRTLLQLMVESNSKKMLTLPIVRFVLHVMWFEFGFQKFILDFLRFFLYAVCVATTVGMFESGLRVDAFGADYIDESARNLSWIPPFAISAAISLTLFAQELAEMQKLRKKYLLEVKNYWDLSSIFIFWLMGFGMFSVQYMSDVESVLTGDILIKACNTLLQFSFIAGFLEFAAVPKVSGPFVSTIWSMLSDVGKFFGMFAVFYLCFIAAMWPVARDSIDLPNSIALSMNLQIMFYWMVGEMNSSALADWHNKDLASMVFFLYAVVCSVLLLNMLIAMMNNTYTLVLEDAEGEWCLNWARYMCYSYESASENDKLCVTTFLKECSGKTQEQTLEQVSLDEEEKSWVDDVRDGVAMLRSDVTTLADFMNKQKAGIARVSTRAKPTLVRVKSAISRLGSAVQLPIEQT